MKVKTRAGWAALILSFTDCQCSRLRGCSLRYVLAFNGRTRGLSPRRAALWREDELGELGRVMERTLGFYRPGDLRARTLGCSVSLLIKLSLSHLCVGAVMRIKWKQWRWHWLVNSKLVIITDTYYLTAASCVTIAFSSSQSVAPSTLLQKSLQVCPQ